MDNVFTELEYLSNPAIYEKYKTQKQTLDDEGYKKDKKFYKKRVIQMTKNLYNNNNIEEYNVPLLEIKNSFHKYIYECIQILKLIDKNDSIQEEYSDLSSNSIGNPIDTSFTVIENDSIIFNKPSTHKIEDCFPITIKKTKKKSDIKLPVQKELNLKDPKFKTKGVKKKE